MDINSKVPAAGGLTRYEFDKFGTPTVDAAGDWVKFEDLADRTSGTDAAQDSSAGKGIKCPCDPSGVDGVTRETCCALSRSVEVKGAEPSGITHLYSGTRKAWGAEAAGASRSFWVVEQFIDGQSQGYWDGGSSRSFVRDIDKAVQYCRQQDAFWATRGWHWKDTKITEHVILGAAAPAPQVPAVPAVAVEAVFIAAAKAFAQSHIDCDEMEVRDELSEDAVTDHEYEAKNATYNRTKKELVQAYRALAAQPTAAVTVDMTAAAEDVLAERQRQKAVEGWSATHDEDHESGELAQAAACYAYPEMMMADGLCAWPWSMTWWKPKDRRRNLVRAGALILAEIERLDRATPKQGGAQ